MKKAIALIALLSGTAFAQVQLGRNVQLGAGGTGPTLDVQTNGVDNLSQTLLDLDQGSNVTITNTSGGHVRFDATTGIMPQVIPPIGGQYVVIPASTGTLTNDEAPGRSTINSTSGNFVWTCSGIFCTIAPLTTANWSGFALPSYVNPANVTAIYADVITSAQSVLGRMPFSGANGTSMYCGSPGSPQLLPANVGSPWLAVESTKLLSIAASSISSLSCPITLGASGSGDSGEIINVSAVRLIVYYTGTAPPADTRVQVVPPLLYNSSLNQLLFDPLGRGYLQPLTVATLPTAIAASGEIFQVTDGTSSTDCTSGGGSTINLCRSNGTTWAIFSSGGGGGTPGGSTTQIQYNNAGAFGGDSGFTTDGAGHETMKSVSVADGTGTAGLVAIKQGTAASTVASSVGLTAPASVTAYNFTLPAAQGTGCLANDGSGNGSWAACSGGGGAGAWSALTNPTGNLALSMGSNLSTFSFPGVFTNTQMNQPFKFLGNGINLQTEFQTEQGGIGVNNATESASFGLAVPSGSSVYQTEAAGFYTNSASTSTNAVAGYFSARSLGTNVRIWAINPLFDDGGFNTYGYANETDCNVSNASTPGPCQLFDGLPVAGNNFGVIDITTENPNPWKYGYKTENGKTVTAISIGAATTSSTSNSQPIVLNATSLGTTYAQTLSAVPGGFVMQAPANSLFAPALEVDTNDVSGFGQFGIKAAQNFTGTTVQSSFLGQGYCPYQGWKDATPTEAFGLCYGVEGALGGNNPTFSFYNGTSWASAWFVSASTGKTNFQTGVVLPITGSTQCLHTDTSGNVTGTGADCGSGPFSVVTSGTNTTAAMLVGSGASLAPTGTGTIQATNISSTVSAGTGIAITGSGTTASPYVVAATGGSSVATVASSETVASSATPTFSTSFNVSYNVLTANVTSFTLAAGSDGQSKTLTFCQNGTGGFTVTPPANVHGFFTVGASASKCNSQHFNYSTAQTAWLADSAGVINE